MAFEILLIFFGVTFKDAPLLNVSKPGVTGQEKAPRGLWPAGLFFVCQGRLFSVAFFFLGFLWLVSGFGFSRCCFTEGCAQNVTQ